MSSGRSSLRRMVDVAALGLCLVVATLVAIQQGRSESVDSVVTQTELAVARFYEVLRVQATTRGVAVNGRGWPNTIEGAWFGDDPPRNHLLSGDRPWVEIAPPEDADRDHPADPVAFDLDVEPGTKAASFWYNPYRGVVRARVPPQINDAQTLALYNRVNGVLLTSLSPEDGLRSAQQEQDDAKRLEEIARRVQEMAESVGVIRTPGEVVRVRRPEPPRQNADDPALLDRSDPGPATVDEPTDAPQADAHSGDEPGAPDQPDETGTARQDDQKDEP
ncbi:MAG: hypothetical protein KatS3mg103_0854 [Phycisphaerales bacterium]|nr:MAG: hypothetical protein KatS3mg103_0854 [Phycisphaerales bacterium]